MQVTRHLEEKCITSLREDDRHEFDIQGLEMSNAEQKSAFQIEPGCVDEESISPQRVTSR